MFNKEIAEKLATTLSHLQCIPAFHDADLLISDIADPLGFQIHCKMNDNGRLVFSVNNSERFPLAQKSFKLRYTECYSDDIRETPASDKQIYPTSGSDSILDLAPGTITRLMLIESEFDTELQSMVPVFVLKLGEEVKKWETYFQNMADNIGSLRQYVENIYNKSL